MKVSIIENAGAETEVIIRCDRADDNIRRLAAMLDGRKIPVRDGDSILLLSPIDVLYCEYVDGGVFAYTTTQVYPARLTLAELDREHGFFRCSKTMVVNLRAIDALRSGDCGRIIATMCNGEKLIISRHYAVALRSKLLSNTEEVTHE